jgi:deoxyadenosine/deoxycytidine kinase
MISIEGNIGVGKSSVLKILEARGFTVREEQVHLWSLLPLFYAEKKKYAFAFQLQVLTSYIGASANFVERSALSALLVFADMLKEEGFINSEDFIILDRVCSRILKPVSHIYLRLDASLCLERLRKRGRPGEENISLEYLQKLEAKHDKVFSDVIHLTGAETPEGIADLILNRL